MLRQFGKLWLQSFLCGCIASETQLALLEDRITYQAGLAHFPWKWEASQAGLATKGVLQRWQTLCTRRRGRRHLGKEMMCVLLRLIESLLGLLRCHVGLLRRHPLVLLRRHLLCLKCNFPWLFLGSGLLQELFHGLPHHRLLQGLLRRGPRRSFLGQQRPAELGELQRPTAGQAGRRLCGDLHHEAWQVGGIEWNTQRGKLAQNAA
mmetsp:Transcript_63766/g.113466  ORF Transcript_63766/g.113466 Transcript_63766/m.113466 type:complete len:206 (+) Transcript_63766:1072-1689(+)